MQRQLQTPLFCALLALFTAALPAGETLRVGGSGSALGLFQRLAQGYEKQHPGIRILVLPSIGSSGGIQAVIDGKLDFGVSNRALIDDERVAGIDFSAFATTAFVFISSMATPMEPLSLRDVEDIYAGRRAQWKDGSPIRIILRPRSDSAHSMLVRLSPGLGAAVDQAHGRPGIALGMTDQDALSLVEQTPGAFGTALLGTVQAENRRVRILSIKDWPGRRDRGKDLSPAGPTVCIWLLHRPGSLSDAGKNFLAYLRSKESRKTMAGLGFWEGDLSPPASWR